MHDLWLAFEMEDNTLYLLSNQLGTRKTSEEERLWLEYLISKGRDISTEWNSPYGQESVVGNYFPDGIEKLSDGSVRLYEFLGCVVHNHHGYDPSAECPASSKFGPTDRAPFGTTMEKAAQATKKKFDTYDKHGFSYVCMWECKFKQLKKESEDLKQFLDSYENPAERLRLRTALRGKCVKKSMYLLTL